MRRSKKLTVFLPRRDHIPDRLSDRHRPMGFLVGVDPDDLAGDQRVPLALPEDRKLESNARIADPRHPRADVQLPVEQHRRLVLDQRFDDVEIDPGRLGVGKLVVAQRAKILGDGGVEIGQVMRVEDDALPVDLGIADTKRDGRTRIDRVTWGPDDFSLSFRDGAQHRPGISNFRVRLVDIAPE